MHIQAVQQSLASESAKTSSKLLDQNQQVPTIGGDAFDGSAEPTIYMSDNRMPVMIEFSSMIVYVVFAALLLALLFILPGVRRKKMTSLLALVTLLLVGASLLLSLAGSHWLTGELQLHEAPYGALTSETITGKLEVNIGLSSTNVTLYGRIMGNSGNKQVDYNERFHWDRPDRMLNEHEEALRRGLPYPILTITEFLSQDSDGFNWMRQLRLAGYYTSFALYVALAFWCLTMVIMCLLPIYLPHMMQITGVLMMLSVWVYTLLIKSPRGFVVQMGEAPMELTFGRTYMTAFVAGALSMSSGVVMFILQMNTPHDQFTIMDCDNYLKNQRALYWADRKSPMKTKKSHHQNSVVTPIVENA